MHEIKLAELKIIWFGHASFMIRAADINLYVDPYVLPTNPEKADIVLVTHDHFDHFNTDKIKSLRKTATEVIGSYGVIDKLGFGTRVKPGDDKRIRHIDVRPVEAYNINKFRSPGQPFHPKGYGVGYVITINNMKIYHAGDTDHIQEMASLQDIDLALLPIGGTYTMTVNEAADAANAIKPRFLVPMHYNSDKYGVKGINANPEELAKALAGKGIVVNILEPMI